MNYRCINCDAKFQATGGRFMVYTCHCGMSQTLSGEELVEHENMTATEVREREDKLFATPRPQLDKALEDFLMPALKNIVEIYERIKNLGDKK